MRVALSMALPMALAIACGGSSGQPGLADLLPTDAVSDGDAAADAVADAIDDATRDPGEFDAPDVAPDAATDPGLPTDVPAADDVDAPSPDDTPASDAADIAPTDDLAGFLPDVAGLSNLSCKEFYRECASQCPKGANDLPEPACFQACRTTLSADGATTLDAFLACLQSSGCDLKPDATARLTCYGQACGESYTACFHGNLGCNDVLKCAQACPQGDGNGACVVACSQDGTADAQAQLVAILQCIAAACCPNDAAACGTTEGKACSKQVFQVGGQCFTQGVQCVTS